MNNTSPKTKQNPEALALCRGLLVNIYTTPLHKRCAMGGISETHTEALLIDEQNPNLGPVEVSNLRPTVRVVRRQIKGLVVTAEPCLDGDEDRWRMAGGAFVYTCDSRFSDGVCRYPISLHDRIER